MTFLVDLWDDLCHGRKQKNGSPIHLLQLEHLVSWAVVVTVLHTTHWAFLYLRFLIFCDAHSQICHTSRPEPDSNPTWTRPEPDQNSTQTVPKLKPNVTRTRLKLNPYRSRTRPKPNPNPTWPFCIYDCDRREYA